MKGVAGKDMNVLSETLEKVKKGLECCSKNALDPCIGCPYERIGDGEWKCGLNADALALIQQLESQVKQLKFKRDVAEAHTIVKTFVIDRLERERDAAVEELKGYGCTYCKRLGSPDENFCGEKCDDFCNWEWCGVKEDVDEQNLRGKI